MKRWLIYIIATLLAPALHARLELVQSASNAFVICGKGRQIEVTFHNPDGDVETTVQTRIYQATSATLAPIGETKVWKKLRVLAGEKVIETATFDFPEVRTVTEFEIRWLDQNNELGRTIVQVCPTNLLGQISVTTSNKPIAVLDPQNELKPLLKNSNVKFRDLELNNNFGETTGELAIVFTKDMADDLARDIAKATKPTTIIWIQHLSMRIPSLPNMYFVQKGLARVAVADATLFADLGHSAVAQINLLRCIRAAQHPETLKLPTKPKS